MLSWLELLFTDHGRSYTLWHQKDEDTRFFQRKISSHDEFLHIQFRQNPSSEPFLNSIRIIEVFFVWKSNKNYESYNT